MNKGFTLVEIIAVITILGLLAIITTPAYDTISKNIKTRNYNSKQSTITSQTLSYVEKYMKDTVYGGESSTNTLCFTVNYLIRNGIISSDSDKEEYIENDVTNEKFEDDDIYVKVWYDTTSLKLKADAAYEKNEFDSVCDLTY